MKSLSEIEDLLRAANEEARRGAVLALETYARSDEVKQAVRLLAHAMRDGSWRIRKTALETMVGAFSPDDYIDSLIELLYVEDNAGARNTAVEALVRLGPKATSRLIEAFNSQSGDVRKFIVDIIGEVGDSRAGDLLVRALSDEDENVKSSAVEHLGTFKEPAIVDLLIGILESGDLWTAYPAAEALGKIGDRRAVPVLLKALDNGMLKEPALRALGRMGGEDVLDRIVPLIADKSRSVQHMAIYSIEELYHRGVSEGKITGALRKGLGDNAVQMLLDHVLSPRDEVKASSILLLGLMKDERALQPLLEMAQDETYESDIRRALVFLGKEQPEVLLHIPRTDNPLLARFVCSVYSEVAAPLFYEVLLDYLGSDDGHVRSLAAVGLGKIGNVHAVEKLKVLMSDEFEDVQEAAVKSILLLKEGLDEDELRENLKSDNPLLRKNSVQLFVAFESEEALRTVSSMLNDEDASVRKAALKALSSSKSDTAYHHIEMTLTDEDPSLRTFAAQKLGETGQDRFLEPLAALLSDNDGKVRASAAKALGTLGFGQAVEKLVHLLDEQNGFVVTAAIEAMGKLGGDDARRSLVGVLSHKEKEIQRAAIDALSSFPDSEDTILPFLNDADWATRAVAAQSLQPSEKEFVKKELQKALEHEEDSVVRKALMGALGA